MEQSAKSAWRVLLEQQGRCCLANMAGTRLAGVGGLENAIAGQPGSYKGGGVMPGLNGNAGGGADDFFQHAEVDPVAYIEASGDEVPAEQEVGEILQCINRA